MHLSVISRLVPGRPQDPEKCVRTDGPTTEPRAHRACVTTEPGREAAGAPHSHEKREALNRDDDVTQNGVPGFLDVIRCRDPLAHNTHQSPHGRAALLRGIAGGHPAKRPWMWLQHVEAGGDQAMPEREEPA